MRDDLGTSVDCIERDDGSVVQKLGCVPNVFWKDKGRDYVLLVITSGENKYSQLAFSYKRVVFEDLGSKFYPSYVGICKNKVGKVCDKRKKTRKKK